ncbi:hypothetical protein BEN48_05475 [Hymenobacter glacialis]|uniref:Uncharacterized protein n=1 Tax=Hymenobacter glacialis TaxID=1908236 RepID=A0A1G1SST6_9BACT|nr:hypothetical protein BEN48_05475 [Hymenobacter glacialis]
MLLGLYPRSYFNHVQIHVAPGSNRHPLHTKPLPFKLPFFTLCSARRHCSGRQVPQPPHPIQPSGARESLPQRLGRFIGILLPPGSSKL